MPSSTTTASQPWLTAAAELAQACPSVFGQEIALTGAVATGIAFDDSEVTLQFWIDAMPPAPERAKWAREAGLVDWLRLVGARDIMVESEPLADGSMRAVFLFSSVWFDARWQSIPTQEHLLQRILGGHVLDHDLLITAEETQNAIGLRTEGRLAGWQEWLATYPLPLQQQLVTEAVESFAFPAYRSLGHTDDPADALALSQALALDVNRVLRLLFALNRQWEPAWKWLEHTTGRLAIKPADLTGRINQVFYSPDPQDRVRICLELIRDSLALLPATYDAERATTTIAGLLG